MGSAGGARSPPTSGARARRIGTSLFRRGRLCQPPRHLPSFPFSLLLSLPAPPQRHPCEFASLPAPVAGGPSPHLPRHQLWGADGGGQGPEVTATLLKSSDNAKGAGGEQSRRSAPPPAAPPAGGWLHAPGRACRGRATRRRVSCWPPRPPPDPLR